MARALSSPGAEGVADTGEPTERRIVDAATRLFGERGYHAVGMRELADAVGLRPASLYNHYGSKVELLFAIAHGTMVELHEGAQAAVARHEEPRERLRAWVEWHVGYHAANRERAKVADEQLGALDAARLAEVVAARDAYADLVKGLLDAGREAHGWVVPHRSVLTNAITTMCTAVDGWFRPEGALSAQEVGALYADFVLAGLERGAAG
jgi:AcrR family transcriptional regulator